MFDTKSYKWRQVNGLKVERMNAACAVFEGRVVICGGRSEHEILKSVEAYDHAADEWTYMPSMIKERGLHKITTVRNKLFVVGGDLEDYGSCEVFNSFSNTFVRIKSPPDSLDAEVGYPVEVISVGTKIFVFPDMLAEIAVYDVEKETWSVEKLEVTENLSSFACCAVPKL